MIDPPLPDFLNERYIVKEKKEKPKNIVYVDFEKKEKQTIKESPKDENKNEEKAFRRGVTPPLPF